MSFFDHIYSSSFWFMLIMIVWIFGFIILSFLSPFKNKNLNGAYKAVMFLLSGSIMVVPMFFYYGLADDFERIRMGNTTLSLEENYDRGGEGPSETVNRLTVLDKKTGERKDRLYIGYAGDLLGQKGDTLVYFYNYDLHVMNAATMTELYHIAKDDWGKQYPELAEGVDQVNDNQNGNDPEKLYISVKGKNGKNYWYDPYAKTMQNTQPKDEKLPGIYSRGYEIVAERNNGSYQKTMLTQVSVPNSDREKIGTGDAYAHLFGSETEEDFIDPYFFCIDTVKKCFVFRHYKTTDKKKVWIESKDFNFKTLWKKDAAGLDAEDGYGSEYYGDQTGVQFYENGLLYFNLSGFMFCMEPRSGEIKWKTRL